jgi:hypothetical protein
MVKLLLFFAASPAFAFTLGQTGFDGGWSGKTVSFYYNSANCPASVPAAIDKAMDLWSKIPTSNLKLKLAGASTITPTQLLSGTASPVPVIVCDPSFESNSGASADFVGGYGFFTHAGSKINYGGLVLNVQAGKNANINNFDATSLAVLLAHEIGHVLGLGHSEYHPALMYYDISSKTELSLAQDDMDGITYLYPRDEFKDGLYGCGRVSALPPSSGAAAFLLWLIPLAMLAFLRRRAAAGYAAA